MSHFWKNSRLVIHLNNTFNEKVHFLSCLISAILFSCTDDIEYAPKTGGNNLKEFQGVQHDILVNVLTSHYGGYQLNSKKTRAISDFSISPYVEHNDTVMYIVQYRSGGWEIYSANQAVKAMIFASAEGYFNMLDPKMPQSVKDLILENARALKSLPKDSNIPVHESWGASSLTEEDFAKGKITVKRRNKTRSTEQISYDALPPGHWVLISTENYSSTYTSTKLTKTKWDQSYPWNKYAKCVTTTSGDIIRGYVGCVPVAIGQYLYYTHFKNNVPLFTVTTATPINGGMDYSFSGQSSTIWDDMAISTSASGNYDATALFLGYLGRKVNADYREDGTYVYNYEISYYLNPVFDTYFNRIDFDFDQVKYSLDNSLPIIAIAYSDRYSNGVIRPNGIAGHCFLIDRYREVKPVTKMIFGLIRDPWTGPGDDPYEDNIKDPDGNIIDWVYTNEIVTYGESEMMISMNWGYSGRYDHLFYSPWTSDWDAGGHKFNLNHSIFIRGDIHK